MRDPHEATARLQHRPACRDQAPEAVVGLIGEANDGVWLEVLFLLSEHDPIAPLSGNPADAWKSGARIVERAEATLIYDAHADTVSRPVQLATFLAPSRGAWRPPIATLPCSYVSVDIAKPAGGQLVDALIAIAILCLVAKRIRNRLHASTSARANSGIATVSVPDDSGSRGPRP